MHFSTTTLISLLALSTSILATPLSTLKVRDQDDDSDRDINIFPSGDGYNDFAICRGKITKERFPNLQAPSRDGGCVRYYPGIDMTGVVTTVNLFFKDGIKNACDCAAACLDRPASCTNWVFKHTFMAGLDGGKRSCTLYSSPNLPLSVTLAYDINNSKNFAPLGANPQLGCDAPLTFLDANSTMPDKFGVSGFAVRDTNQRQYC
jgi:hypothetical protein